jgi:selenocysteine-specific elongation factor
LDALLRGLSRPMIIGTAGHIDHGKTSLVRALTGVDTDRLKEEKQRGISIELGYAYVTRTQGEALGYIDVPGHERLVHTMVAGAGGVDFALLVVAADDGVMPQTREHLAILELLGVRRGAVALTKVDRVDDSQTLVATAQIRQLLSATRFDDTPIFQLNATRADDAGVAALRKHLEQVAEGWHMRSDAGLFRLPVDRVFTLPGLGTVATGTAMAGRVRVGDTIAVMPSAVEVRVRSIHAQHRDTELGRAGQRCALNLVGIDKSGLHRGDWLADARALTPSTRIDVQLRWLAGGAQFKDRAPLHVHLGTADRVAEAVLLESDTLQVGCNARAQLVFEAPLCAGAGDAFIVRDAQARRTVGGGIVIDPCAPARRRRSPERLAYLTAIQNLLLGGSVLALLQNAPSGMSMRELVRLTGFAPERIDLPTRAHVVGTPDDQFVLLDSHWRILYETALTTLEAFHAQYPDEPGIDRARLRRLAAPRVNDGLWRALIDELLRDHAVVRSDYWLHLPQHRVSLDEREHQLAGQLQSILAAARNDPPWVRDLAARVQAPEEQIRQVLRKCAVQRQVYQIVKDLFYHRDTVQQLARELQKLYLSHGVVSAAQFRDTIGIGRKRSIQVLEFFDRVAYTRRLPHGRIVRADSSWHDSVRG